MLDGDNEEYIVKFIQSERYYTVNANGDVEYIKVTNGEKILTVQCVDSKNQLLLEYQYMILQDQYSKKAPEIAGYIPHEESITGEITEDTTITFIYYLIFTFSSPKAKFNFSFTSLLKSSSSPTYPKFSPFRLTLYAGLNFINIIANIIAKAIAIILKSFIVRFI